VWSDAAADRTYGEYGAERVKIFLAHEVNLRFDEFWLQAEDELTEQLIDECLGALSQMALPFDTLASTLQFFAGHRDGRCIAGHLGDGAQMLVGGADGELSPRRPLTEGVRPGEPCFVTSYDAQSHLHLQRSVLQGPGVLLMMGDGVEPSLYRYGGDAAARHWLYVHRSDPEYPLWLTKAAGQGCLQACYELGNYWLGRPLPERDCMEAVRWYHRAAVQGHPRAQTQMGRCSLYGWGTDEDPSNAVYWVTLAARQGDAEAQAALDFCRTGTDAMDFEPGKQG